MELNYCTVKDCEELRWNDDVLFCHLHRRAWQDYCVMRRWTPRHYPNVNELPDEMVNEHLSAFRDNVLIK